MADNLNLAHFFTGYDALQYQVTLQAKIAELQDLVEAHIVESAKRHKGTYDQKSAERSFKTGDIVWLSIPTGPTMGREMESENHEVSGYYGDYRW